MPDPDAERLYAAQAAERAGLTLGMWYHRAPPADGVDYPRGKSGITKRYGVGWWWESTVDALVADLASRPSEADQDWHGTPGGYDRHRRLGSKVCEPCRRLRAEYMRQWRNAKAEKGLPPDDPRHGSLHGYYTFNCRCDPCRNAFKQYYYSKK